MSEKLSNLLDHSIEETDLDEFLQACMDDPELVDTWQRYHIARDGIRNEISTADIEFDVASRVVDSIQKEQFSGTDSNVKLFTGKTSRRISAWPWLSVALAASLVLGVYLAATRLPVSELKVAPQLADTSDVNTMPHWQTSNTAIEHTLNSLLVEHSEFTSITGMNGLGSYSKFVAYQN